MQTAVARLSLLKFFPADPQAKAEVAALLSSICHSPEQVVWLVNRVLALFNEWPGPREIRAVACSKFKPRDGVEEYSETYPEGIPSERPEVLALPPAAPRALLAEIAQDAGIELQSGAGAIGQRKPMKALPPIPAGKEITSADVAREIVRLAAKKVQGDD